MPKGRKSFGAVYLDGYIYSMLQKLFSHNYINYSKSYLLITACGGYSLLLEVKECYRLNLNNVEAGWEAIAPLLKGRFNFQLVAAKGLIYAVGGEGPFGDHDDIEVRLKVARRQSHKFP